MMGQTPPALIEITSRHQVYLEGHKTQIANEFAPFLVQMSKNLERLLLNKDLTEFSRGRLEKLLESVRSDLADEYMGFYKVWREQIVDISQYEAEFEIKSLNQVMDYNFDLPSKSQLREAVLNTPLKSIKGPDGGKLLKDFYRGWTGRSIDQTTSIISQGYFQGKTTPQIVRELKGTAGKGFRDGQLARGNKDISILTRTAVQHAANESRGEVWKNNDDIITGIQIVATLDDHTCPQCQPVDGEIFGIDEGPRPPFHPGCRCSTVAVIDGRLSVLSEGRTRAARDDSGKVEKVSAKETYYSWLKKQDSEFINSVIGPTRGKLLLNGGLSAERFSALGLNDNFEPRTLFEMKALEPLAFKRAGIEGYE